MNPPSVRSLCVAALAVGLLAPAPARAQHDTSVVADARYAKGAVHRLFFGNGYRELWTTPIRAPILDVRTYAGGLRPLSAGGGFQTASLWFRGADGYKYGFRGVVKLPGVLPVEIESTFVKDLVQDQISAGHPGAPAVVAPLLEAAGVLHTDPTLFILPLDAPLDTFCTRFCGLLGFLQRLPVADSGYLGFDGADSIIKSRRLFPRLRASPANLVDQHALLTARLMDVFFGDWDRHRGQWTWARFGTNRPVRWVPIPEDRDQAFARFNGLLLDITRTSGAPFLLKFSGHYSSIVGETWNGRDVDRWFLGELERPTWDSIALYLQGRLTDSVIDDAVRRLPDAWYARNGARLSAALKHRRDDLPREASRYYRLLAREAEVHGTAVAEDVGVERTADGRLTVRVTERGAAAPWFARTYDPHDTREVRLYPRGGGDRVVVRGEGPDRITVRVVADSQVVVADSSRGGVKVYDAAWLPWRARRKVRISGLPQRPGAALDEPTPPRDWGARLMPQAWLTAGPDIGVFLGYGVSRRTFAFRRLPFASQWRLRAGYAVGADESRVGIDGLIRPAESRLRFELGAYASGIEVLRWNGVGNATTVTLPDPHYRVNQAQVEAYGRAVIPLGNVLEFRVGPSVLYSHTRIQPGRIIADSLPYGSANFGQAGLKASLGLTDECCWRRRARLTPDGDSIGTDSSFVATRAIRLTVGGSAYPALWNVDSAFGDLHGEVSGFVTARRAPLRPTLAFRAGAKRVFGRYPFTEAAFIGDAATVRLGRKNRYAGDAAVWGNAELRLALTPFFVILPGEFGVFGLADVGRVFVRGESSDRWHSAVGGGVWISLLQPANILSLAFARSAERTAIYLGAGFAY
jgi:hypothetical protein